MSTRRLQRSHFCFNEIPLGFFHGIILCSAKRSRIPPKRMTDFVYCGWLLEVCTDWYVHTFCLAAINTKYHTMTTYYWVCTYLYITLYTDPQKRGADIVPSITWHTHSRSTINLSNFCLVMALFFWTWCFMYIYNGLVNCCITYGCKTNIPKEYFLRNQCFGHKIQGTFLNTKMKLFICKIVYYSIIAVAVYIFI